MDIQNQLFQAMEVIAQKYFEKQDISKIIKCTISSADTNEDGSYNLHYLDGKIKAYPQNEALKYSEGESVFVLLPSGQMSDRKTILGTTASRPDNMPSIDEDVVQDLIDSTVTTGKNYITSPKEAIRLDRTVKSYPVSIDPIFLKHYPRSQSHMRVRANVESTFDRFNLPSGFSYGIKITIVYSNQTEKIYDFNYLNMAGNIYNLTGGTQDLVFEIPTALTPISASGELYLVGLGLKDGEYVNFSKLSLELLSDVLTDIIANKRYRVNVYSDSGTVFEEDATKNVSLICQIISEDGIDVDPFGFSFAYEWYAISFDNQGNKIKPAEPVGTNRELIVNLGNQSAGVAYYECDVYPKINKQIKKLDR